MSSSNLAVSLEAAATEQSTHVRAVLRSVPLERAARGARRRTSFMHRRLRGSDQGLKYFRIR